MTGFSLQRTQAECFDAFLNPYLDIVSSEDYLIYLCSFVEVDGCNNISFMTIGTSVTRLGNFLCFGQLFKARGNNYFAQIINTF